MTTLRRHRPFIAALLTLHLAAWQIGQPIQAATVYWDIDGAVVGAGGATPTGTWDGSNAFWNARYDGGAATAIWVAGDTAVFAAGTNATGGYTVNVTGTQSVGGLSFEEGGVTLAGGILDLGSVLRDVFVGNGLTASINSVLTGTGGGIVKNGAGTLELQGANTYTGATQLSNGTLRLNFGAAGAPASDILYNGVTAAGLTFGSSVGGGAALSMIGTAGATSQALGGITLSANSGAAIAVDASAGGAATLALGNITRAANNGSSIRFTLPVTGSITTTAANDASGILGPWAVVGSGSTQRYASISGGAIAGYSGGTTITDINSATSATTNYDISTLSVSALGASRQANTLRFALAGAQAVDIPGNTTLRIETNGIMNVGGGTLSITRSGSGANGEIRPATSTGTPEMTFSGSSQITVAVPVANNTAASRVVVNMDPGVILRIDTTATNTGGWTVNSGILEVGNVNIGSATASTITINNGATLRTTTGTNSVTDTSTVRINDGGTWIHNNNNATSDTIAFLLGSGVITSTAGTNRITINSGTAPSDVWAGSIQNGGGSLVITKAGANTVEFTGNNTYTGGTTISGGTLIVSGPAGRIAGTTTIGDNNGADEVLQLGRATDVIYGALDRVQDTGGIIMSGSAQLNVFGPAAGSTGTTETIATLTAGAGRSVINLTPATGGTVQLTAGTLARTANGTALVRGTGLGSTGADTARLFITTAPAGANFVGGSTTAGALNLNIVPWLVGAATPTSAGSGFLTFDATNGLRLLTGSEYAAGIAGNAGNNINNTGGETFSVASTNFAVNSMLLGTGTTTINGSTANPRNYLTVTSGAILSTGGNTLTGTGRLNFGATEGVIHAAANTTAVTATLGISLIGTGGITVGSMGDVANIVALTGANLFTGGVRVNSGILQVGNANALGGIRALNALTLTAGATLQLNGNSIAVGSLTAPASSVIENVNAANVTLRVHQTADATNATVIRNGTGAGILSLVKTGANRLELTGASSFTGPLVVSQGTLQLGSNSAGGTLTGANIPILVGGGAILRLNSQGGNASTDRIVNTATVTLRAGVLDFDVVSPGATNNYSETIGTLGLAAGFNQITVDPAANSAGGQNSTLTITNFNRTQGAVVQVNPATLGNVGTGTTSSTVVDGNRHRLVLTNLNGVATANNDGILPGWLYANAGADFATYLADVDTDTAGNQPSVATFAAYNANLATASWTTSSNVFYDTLGAQTLGGATTVNSLKITSTGGTNTLNLGGNTLTVDTGGILYVGTGTNAFTGISNGSLTAQGGTTTAPDLVVRTNNSTDTITLSANIIDGAGGATGFTKSGPGNLALSGSSTYTGPTSVVGGSLRISADNNLGTAPGTAAAGHLKIYGGTLETTAGFTLDANRRIEIGDSSAAITASTGNLIYNGTISQAVASDVTSLTLTGDIDMALAADIAVGGSLVLTGGSGAQSLVTLGGTNNVIGGGLVVARGPGRQARLVYSGAGNLSVGTLDPGTANLDIGNANTAGTGNVVGELDLSGLTGTFTANVANLRVGFDNVGGGAGYSYQGSLKLGASSNIVATSAVLLGDSPNDGGSATLANTITYGAGTHTLTTPLFTVGGRKVVAPGTGVTLEAGANVSISGFGPAASELRIAYNNVGTGAVGIGTFDASEGVLKGDFSTITVGFKNGGLTGGANGALIVGTDAANHILATNVVVGDQRSSETTTTANVVQGTFTFGGGTLGISQNLTIGNHQGANTAARVGQGTVNLDGGTATVGGNVVVANTAPTGGTGAHATNGTLNITGGNLSVAGNLVIGNTTSNIAASHAATGVVNLNSASSTVTIAGDVLLGNVDSVVSNPTATGTVNVLNGTLTVTGNIGRTLLNGADASQSRGFVNVAGGALDMTSGTILAKSLAYRSGTISNVAAGGVTLEADSTTSTTTISGITGDALILRDVTLAANVALTGATSSNVHYENANGGTGGTLNGNLDLGTAGRTFNIEDSALATADLTVSGIVSNIAPITKTGAGTLVLSGANTFSGAVTVSTGTLVAGSSQGLSNANVAVNVASGAFLNANGFANTIGSLTGAGTVQNGAVAAGTLTLGAGNAGGTFSGTIQDGAGGGALNLVKTGSGTINLTGASNLTYTGSTTISGGVLNAGLRGTQTIIQTGGSLNLTDSAPFVLNLGSTGNVLQLSGGTLGFELGATGDKIVLAGTATALTSGTTTLDIFGLPGLAAGTYRLVDAPNGGLLSTNGSSGLFTLGSTPSGFTFATNFTDNFLDLTLTAFTGKYWRGDVDGSWITNNSGDTNWATDAAGTLNSSATPVLTDSVLFSTSNATGPAIATTLDGAFSVKELLFLSQPPGVTSVSIAAGTGGTLTITSAIAASEGISVAAGAGNVSISAPLTIGANQRWEVVNALGTSLTVSGDLSGSASINKTGTGVATLSGTNVLGVNGTYSGAITLTAGQLNLNSATALGTGGFVIAGGTLDNTTAGAITLTTNNTQSWNGNFAFAGTQNLTFGTGAVTLGGNRTITTSGSGQLIQQGDIGGAFSITKAGAGTLVLAGNGSTYSAGTTISAGTLVAVVTGASGSPVGSGDITLNAGAFALRGDGTGSGGTIAVGNNLVVGGSATVDVDRLTANTGNIFQLGTLSIGASTLTVNSTNSYGLSFTTASLTGNATITNSSGTVTIGGAIGGAFSLTKSGAGILALNGNSTFSGGIIQTTGTISLGHKSGLGAGLYNVTGASTLDVAVDLAGTNGPVTNPILLDAALTITGGTNNLDLSGAISNATGNNSLVNNLTTGLLTLTGQVNLTESSAARTFNIDGTGNTVLSSTSVVQNGGTGASFLNKTGTGTLTINGVNTHTGGTNLSQGTLIIGHQNALGTARLQTQTNNSTIQGGIALTGATALANALTLNVGTTTFTGSNTIEFNGTTTNNGGSRTITNNMTGGAQLILAAVALSNDATNRTLTIRGTADTIVEGVISNGSTSTTGNLTKNDAGTLILLGANTYAGATTVSGGILQIGNGGTTGNINGSSGISLAAGTILRFNRSNALTSHSVPISGAGSVEQVGAGTTTFTSANTYIGTTTISGGGLTIGNNGTAGTLGTGDVILSNSSTLTFNRTDAQTITNNITGTGNVTKTSTGPVTLTPATANTFAGTITVLNNSLVAGNASAFGSAGNNVVVNATGTGITATLDLNGQNYTAGTVTLGGTTATSTPSISTGAGTLSLGGNVTYSATSNPLGGTISGSVDLGAASRVFDVGNSTNAASDLTVSASLAGAAGVGITKSGAGTLVLTNPANDYSGPTIINGGILDVNKLADGGAASGIGDSTNAPANLVLSGGTLRYSGSGDSTNREITLGTLGGTLDSSGAGAVDFTGTAPVTLAGTDTARTFTLAGTNNGLNTLSAQITDNGTGATSLVKSGLGTWNITAANTHSGGTDITTGTFLANNTSGSATGTGSVTVAVGATLGGTGAIIAGVNNNITITGTLTPGTPGLLSGSDLALTVSGSGSITFSTVTFDIFGNTTGINPLASNDRVVVSAANWSNILFNSTLNVNDTTLTSTTWANGDTWRLFDWSGIAAGSPPVTGFTTLNLPTLGSGLFWDTSDLYIGGNIVISNVPEPSRALLLMLGLLGIMIRRRRK